MLCERCGLEEAVGVSASSWASPDGSGGRAVERLCARCSAADRAASEAYNREVRARLADGSIFAQIRAELAAAEAAADPATLAYGAEFIDLLVANLDVPVPPDLRALADRYRDPNSRREWHGLEVTAHTPSPVSSGASGCEIRRGTTACRARPAFSNSPAAIASSGS